MSIINAVVRSIIDLLMTPFRGLSPLVSLVAISLTTAVVMLLVFRATSNQPRIAAVKRQIHACLFEMRLFNDDLRAILRAQLEILRHNVTYLRLSSVPVVWMIVPLLLVIAHLQPFYGYERLAPGQTALVTVEVGETLNDSGRRPEVHLETPAGVSAEASPTWLPQLGELVWRIEIGTTGRHELVFEAGGERFVKVLDAESGVTPRSPLRPSGSIRDQFFYPRETPLPQDGPIVAIRIGLEPGGIRLFGWSMPWLVPFFVLSMAFAWFLRKPFGVTL